MLRGLRYGKVCLGGKAVAASVYIMQSLYIICTKSVTSYIF